MVKTPPKLKGRWLETHRYQKSNHVKGWCGLGWVRSPGDFDGLDALVHDNLANEKPTSQGFFPLANQKKY